MCIRDRNIGNVQRQYDSKFQNLKNKNKKEQVHRKKKVPLTYTNLPVLETITATLSNRERQNNIIYQQKQDSIRTNQPILETTEKIIFCTKSINLLKPAKRKPPGHSSRIQKDKKDTNPTIAINLSIVNVDKSSSIKIFRVDESYTKQDILQKTYSNK